MIDHALTSALAGRRRFPKSLISSSTLMRFQISLFHFGESFCPVFHILHSKRSSSLVHSHFLKTFPYSWLFCIEYAVEYCKLVSFIRVFNFRNFSPSWILFFTVLEIIFFQFFSVLPGNIHSRKTDIKLVELSSCRGSLSQSFWGKKTVRFEVMVMIKRCFLWYSLAFGLVWASVTFPGSFTSSPHRS